MNLTAEAPPRKNKKRHERRKGVRVVLQAWDREVLSLLDGDYRFLKTTQVAALLKRPEAKNEYGNYQGTYKRLGKLQDAGYVDIMGQSLGEDKNPLREEKLWALHDDGAKEAARESEACLDGL